NGNAKRQPSKRNCTASQPTRWYRPATAKRKNGIQEYGKAHGDTDLSKSASHIQIPGRFLMIKLEPNKMQKAIERAKAVRPRVRVINADERTYSVTGSRGGAYTVKFVVANGLKLAECDCAAGRQEMMCFHVASAAQVNVMVQSMRKAAPPADERAELIADIKA